MGVFRISRKLQFWGLQPWKLTCKSPHGKGRRTLSWRDLGGIPWRESLVLHWLSPCQERSFSSNCWALLSSQGKKVVSPLYLIHVSVYCCCSVAQSCLTLSHFMGYSTPGFPGLHYLLEFAQTHVHWVGDAIQQSHPLSPTSPPALNLFQHQGLFQWVNSSHQVANVLEFQLQHQSFQWIFRVDFL